MTASLEAHHDGSPVFVRDTRLHDGTLWLRLRISGAAPAPRALWLRAVLDGEPRFLQLDPVGSRAGHRWWGTRVDVAPGARMTYRFLLDHDHGAEWLTAAGVVAHEPRDADDFLLVGGAAPRWSREGVMYQVFPDRFARSPIASERPSPGWALPAQWDDPVVTTMPDGPRQLFGGDLDGIVERLDHLVELGVVTLYLTPFFPARSNHRYDASTFDRVDPVLGGDQALVRLVRAAHARGLRVIGDLTTNHTGDAHEWFRASRDPHTATADHYLWRDREVGRYECWYDVPSLPKLDWRSPTLRRRFIEGPDSVVGRWLREPFSLDGWRIDVANMTGRDGATDLNHEVQRTIRRTVESLNADALVIAESTNDLPADFGVDGWHGAMTYSTFTRPLWAWLRPSSQDAFGTPYREAPRSTADGFVDHWRRFSSGWSWNARAASLLAIDTHDTPRFRSGSEPLPQLLASLLSFVLPGIPLVYAGDEFGLEGDSGEAGRVPLPWHAGADPVLVDHYRALGSLRRRSSALVDGGLRWLSVGDGHLVLEREDALERVVVAVATEPVSIALAGEGGPLATELGGVSAVSTDRELRLSFTAPGFAVLRGPSRALPWPDPDEPERAGSERAETAVLA